MICGITSGRSKKCSDSVAGFDIVYLFPFVSYDRSQIILNTNIVTTFPDTEIFKFEVLNANLSEEMSEDDGGIFYSQNLSFDLAKTSVEDNLELSKLMDKDYMAIVSDRNGIFRLLGTYNGLSAEVTKVTGGGMEDFNGYKVTMEGKESLSSLFVSNLEDAGFKIIEPIIIQYGYLYNWYAADDSRNIANTGWSVPTIDNQKTLSDFLGGNTVAGGKMKETGDTYWLTPNLGATNTSGFNGRGGGTRIAETGVFDRTKDFMQYWAQGFNTAGGYISVLKHDFATYTAYNGTTWYSYAKATGGAIRLVKDTTTLTDGQTGTYTGNDGKVYRTICIGTQEWLADNLKETKYRNSDAIPEVIPNATWAGLSTGARCSYGNAESSFLTLSTTSVIPNWSPSAVTSTGSALTWDATGDITPTSQNVNDPTFDLTANTGTVNMNVYDVSNVTNLGLNALSITAIDFTKLTSLSQINLSGNLLTSIDITNNTILQYVNFNTNNLTSINSTNATNLIQLQVDDNNLTSIDVSTNTNLQFLNCLGNTLSSLDISNNTLLVFLYCYGNSFSSTVTNQILADLVSNGVTNGNLSYRNNETGQGVTDRATLISRGWNITNNAT